MQTIKSTHRKIAVMHKSLMSIRDIKANNIRFPYAVAKNIRSFESHIAGVRELTAPDVDFRKYDKERVELNVEYSLKEKNNRPRIINNQYIIDPERQAEFDAKIIGLREKHADALKGMDERQKAVEAMLDDECEVSVYKIKLSWIPSDIRPSDLESIMDIIEEDINIEE